MKPIPFSQLSETDRALMDWGFFVHDLLVTVALACIVAALVQYGWGKWRARRVRS